MVSLQKTHLSDLLEKLIKRFNDPNAKLLRKTSSKLRISHTIPNSPRTKIGSPFLLSFENG